MFEERSLQFVYLVQGRRDLALEFLEIVGRLPNILVATWDYPLVSNIVSADRTFYIPHTTWAEGRNFLLTEALKKYPNATYYIFSDEDVRFDSDFLDNFEHYLNIIQPQIAVPLCDRIRFEQSHSKDVLEFPKWHDQNFQAFHQSIIHEGILFPIDTTFDSESWWLTCELQQFLIQTKYPTAIVRFNRLLTTNTHHSLSPHDSTQTQKLSLYANGSYSKPQLEKLKSYIELVHGKQINILGTIFQPRLLDAFYIKHLSTWHLRKVIRLMRRGHFKGAISMLKNVIGTFLVNFFFRLFCPQKTLMGRIQKIERVRLAASFKSLS